MDISLNYDYREEELAAMPFQRLTEFVLNDEEMPENTEVSITFVDDEEMAQLNEEYRGKVGPTDVLSFECDGLDDEFDDFPDFPDDPDDEDGEQDFDVPFTLGDIIIAPDVAERQSADFGTTFEGEMTLLMVHGLLHLCGYDHIEDDEAEEMKLRESEILTAWGEAEGDACAVETLILHGHPFHGREEE